MQINKLWGVGSHTDLIYDTRLLLCLHFYTGCPQDVFAIKPKHIAKLETDRTVY